MDIRINDIIEMKKKHPCSNNKFRVLRIGMDFRIKCMGCQREVMLPRAICEKNIRKIIREEEN